MPLDLKRNSLLGVLSVRRRVSFAHLTQEMCYGICFLQIRTVLIMCFLKYTFTDYALQ